MTKTKTKTKTETRKTPTTTTRHAAPRDNARAPGLPLHALHEIIDWTLDLARRNADGDREGRAAIARIRRAAHAALDGRKYRTPTERDLLTVVALVVTAAERDLGMAGLSDALATTFDVASLQCQPLTTPLARPPVPTIRHLTLPLHTCAHRGPLLAPSVRCVP